MNVKVLEDKILKSIDQEIEIAGSVGINNNDYYDPNIELEELKDFIKKLFNDFKKGELWNIHINHKKSF